MKPKQIREYDCANCLFVGYGKAQKHTEETVPIRCKSVDAYLRDMDKCPELEEER
jgi:hypothetical protein